VGACSVLCLLSLCGRTSGCWLSASIEFPLPKDRQKSNRLSPSAKAQSSTFLPPYASMNQIRWPIVSQTRGPSSYSPGQSGTNLPVRPVRLRPRRDPTSNTQLTDLKTPDCVKHCTYCSLSPPRGPASSCEWLAQLYFNVNEAHRACRARFPSDFNLLLPTAQTGSMTLSLSAR
jgi:hypothetical protein